MCFTPFFKKDLVFLLALTDGLYSSSSESEVLLPDWLNFFLGFTKQSMNNVQDNFKNPKAESIPTNRENASERVNVNAAALERDEFRVSYESASNEHSKPVIKTKQSGTETVAENNEIPVRY